LTPPWNACAAIQGTARTLTLSQLVDEYVLQHQAEPLAKLRWLLAKSVAGFGDTPIDELTGRDIAAWRTTLAPGHRYEATQALRQTLTCAVSWQLIDRNPAKVGADNPLPIRAEQRPFESWDRLQLLAAASGPRYGPILFAAATGLRPGEWIALEHRDIDLTADVVLVRRAFRNGRIKIPKTSGSTRAVPLQAVALSALDAYRGRNGSELLFPAPHGGYLDLHNFRPRVWQPAQRHVGIDHAHRSAATENRVAAGPPVSPPSDSNR